MRSQQSRIWVDVNIKGECQSGNLNTSEPNWSEGIAPASVGKLITRTGYVEQRSVDHTRVGKRLTSMLKSSLLHPGASTSKTRLSFFSITSVAPNRDNSLLSYDGTTARWPPLFSEDAASVRSLKGETSKGLLRPASMSASKRGIMAWRRDMVSAGRVSTKSRTVVAMLRCVSDCFK